MPSRDYWWALGTKWQSPEDSKIAYFNYKCTEFACLYKDLFFSTHHKNWWDILGKTESSYFKVTDSNVAVISKNRRDIVIFSHIKWYFARWIFQNFWQIRITFYAFRWKLKHERLTRSKHSKYFNLIHFFTYFICFKSLTQYGNRLIFIL